MIDRRILEIAKVQASLFEYSCKKKECASSFFVKQFLYSSVAARMSDINFVYSTEDVPEIYFELKEEKKLNIGKEIYPEAVMYWMGYLLAVMSLTKNMHPSQIYRIVTPKELYLCYEAYHSLDIEGAIERIIESKSCERNDLELFKLTRKTKMVL